MTEKRKRLIVIDSNSIIHRAYHALPPLSTKKGDVVNAVYGFLLVFLKAVKEFHPEFIAAAFDVHEPTFRHKKFKEYKAKRVKAPEDLYLQIPKTKEVLEAFNVPIFEKGGYEADDIIGTISDLAAKEADVIILSGDSDSFQLINPSVSVYALRKGVKDVVLYNEEEIRNKYEGLSPEQLIDLKSLRGDPSDNIPGVRGIGEKTALDLIKTFKNIENLYLELEKETKETSAMKPRIKKALLEQKDKAFFCKELVQLEKKVPIDFSLEKCKWGNYDQFKVADLFKDLDFNSLIERIPQTKRQLGLLE